MKIRTDFVTNSSSSSFIVARKDSCTEQDVRDLLYLLEPDIIEHLKEWDYDADPDAVGEFFDELVSELYDTPEEEHSNFWSTFTAEYTNQCDGIVSCFIYEHYRKLQSDHLYVKRIEL